MAAKRLALWAAVIAAVSAAKRLALRAAVTAAVCVAPATAAHAQAPPAPQGDPTLYCVGDGGPLGMATDAEHTVLGNEPPLPAGVRTHRVDVNGVSTRVQEAGPRTATEAVVFIHGSPDSSRDWDDLVAANGRFTRTVAFDIPGYGTSDKLAAETQTTDGAAAYIQGVLDRLGIKRVVLAGHDFGGIWGLQWAAQHKESLIGAVLIDGGVLIDYVPHPFAVVFATPMAGELYMASTTRPTFKSFFETQNPRPFPPGYLDLLYDYYDREARCAILRYYRSSSQEFMTLGREQAAALRPLDLPALVIWGDKDEFVPKDQAQKQKEAFPHARIEIVGDSGHWPHIDNAARVRDLVVPFLRPKLHATAPSRARAGQRRLRVPVRVDGILAAQSVRARLAGGGRSLGTVTEASVSGAKTLTLRLRRPLRAGQYLLTVSARGLEAQAFPLRVRAARSSRGSTRSGPRFTG